MSFEEKIAFTSENLNMYLNAVAKEYKQLSGRKMPAEIILIGGASVLANYGFRESTTDIDAIIQAASCMKDAIQRVSDKYGLYDGWLNADFKRTNSYSEKLLQYSKYYKTFANIVEVRTVAGEYLIAMKLVSGRRYKHDLSDIVGILNYEKKSGNVIDIEMIHKAVEDLYGDWGIVPESSKIFIEGILNSDNLDKAFSEIEKNERQTKEAVLEFRINNPEQTKRKTANEVIEMIREIEQKSLEKTARCVVVGGADIADYSRVGGYLRSDDFVVYCDSGLKHMDALSVKPALIVGDFDSYDDPHSDVETITLPVAKDDTDSVFAVREGMRRGYKEFLLLGVIGARLDHTLVNVYALNMLADNGCHGVIVDDYSEMELISSKPGEDGKVIAGTAEVPYDYPYFSLVAIEGEASGVTIRNAKFPLEDSVISPGYQYATSNEALPGKTAEIELRQGRLLLIKIAPGAAERHTEE